RPRGCRGHRHAGHHLRELQPPDAPPHVLRQLRDRAQGPPESARTARGGRVSIALTAAGSGRPRRGEAGARARQSLAATVFGSALAAAVGATLIAVKLTAPPA